MNAYLERENKTCLPRTEKQKPTKQKKKRDPRCSAVCVSWLKAELISAFVLSAVEGTGSPVCSEVEGPPPPVELLFIYQIKGFGVRQKKGGEESLDNKVEPKCKRVRQPLSFSFFICGGGSDSRQPAPPARCSQPQSPLHPTGSSHILVLNIFPK